MPCSDGREPWITHPSRREDELAKENAKLVERANLNARVACEALRNLSVHIEVNVDPLLSKELKKWWKEHQKQDERRLNAERMEAERQKELATAVAKLTPRERELLGIKYRGC